MATASQIASSETISWTELDPAERAKTLEQLALNGDWRQFVTILAGKEDIGLAESQLLAIAGKLPLPGAREVALQTRSRAMAELLVARLEQVDALMELALKAASVHVRKQAALAIDSPLVLSELREKVRDKDKTVFKVVEQRLGAVPGAQQAQPDAKGKEHEKEREKEHDKAPEKSSQSAAATSAPRVKKTQPPADPVLELPGLEDEIGKLSFKNTARLNAARGSLNRLRKQIGDTGEELATKARELQDKLKEKLDKNREHQEQLKQATESLLDKLKQALEEGQSHDALPTWDKIQGNISNTGGKIRAELQSLANQYKNKLNELRDWKIFAATEKKKELIKQMQHLIDSRMHASDKSRHISTMHKEWKDLGRSNQNEELWREFKKLSDQAYEPCKEFFKQRKQVMAANLKARREVCESLEQELAKLDTDDLNISSLNKLLTDSEALWKKHAPVEQSRIKSLQKRFYGAINQVRRLRKNSLKSNGRRKQEFIDEAGKLAELEDNDKAMQEAKRLQQEWKKIGPTSYKEDKQYWEAFRAACDKIFAQRNQEAAELRAGLEQAETRLNEILDSLEKLAGLADEELRKARSEFQDLARSFTAALDPRIRKQRKKLIDRFNGLKRKIDDRIKALPDKKRQALKEAVLAKSSMLETMAAELLAGREATLDEEAWQQQDAGDFETLLADRRQQLSAVDGADAFEELEEAATAAMRALCVECEIRAEMDTPQEDQSLRMQMQLDQLKNGFGQGKPERKENIRFARDAELKSLCIAPLDKERRQPLSTRLDAAIKRLL